METQVKSTNTTYAVIRSLSGDGYLVHPQAHVGEAVRDNWEVMVANRTFEEAENIRRIYQFAGTPDSNIAVVTDGILTHDFTEEIEIRNGYIIQEFDLIRAPYAGRWIEGTVTYFDEDTVELDGFIEVEREVAEAHAELIAKAETNSFIIEYGEYIAAEQEKWNALVEIAIQASSAVAA